MSEDVEGVVQAVLTAAKSGDMQAARIVMERLVPVRKGAPIAFPLPPVDDIQGVDAALASITDQMAAGVISPEEAHTVAAVVELRRKALETGQLAERIARLEEAQEGKR